MTLMEFPRLLILFSALATMISATRATEAPPPFTLTLVPSKSEAPPRGQFISMANEKPGVFHVVVTNVSNELQPVFETWNSWGYQTVFFEITMPDGRRTRVSVADQNFTRNFPSTCLVPHGEPQVFPIKLDKEWEMNPRIELGSETEITLKAVYEVEETPESKVNGVWAGRVESKAFKLTLRHW